MLKLDLKSAWEIRLENRYFDPVSQKLHRLILYAKWEFSKFQAIWATKSKKFPIFQCNFAHDTFKT